MLVVPIDSVPGLSVSFEQKKKFTFLRSFASVSSGSADESRFLDFLGGICSVGLIWKRVDYLIGLFGCMVGGVFDSVDQKYDLGRSGGPSSQ